MTMKNIGLFLFTLAMIPVNALVSTWAASKYWSWFVEREYGLGPSRGAWYGMFAIFGLALTGLLLTTAKEEYLDDDGKKRAATSVAAIRSVIYPILIACVVGVTFLTGKILGWI